MSKKSNKSKVWSHDSSWWVRTGSDTLLTPAEIVDQSKVNNWNKMSDDDKEKIVAEAYFWVTKQNKVERTRTKVGKKVKVVSKVLKGTIDETKHYETYVIKRISESGCGRDEALNLWKEVSKKLKKLMKKDYIELGDKPPKQERIGGVSSKKKSLEEQYEMWKKKG